MVKFTHLIYKESTRNAMQSMYSNKFLKILYNHEEIYFQ